MDPLSRSMRIVRLAQQQKAMEMTGTSHEAVEPILEIRASTPIHSPVQESEIDTSLNISFTELLPVAGNDSITDLNNGTHSTTDDSFSCYFPTANKKSNILTRGNMIANAKYMCVDDVVPDEADVSTPNEDVSMPTNDVSRPTDFASRPTEIDVSMPAYVDDLPTNVDDLPTNVDDLPTNVDDLPTNVDDLPTNVDDLPTNVDDSMPLDMGVPDSDEVNVDVSTDHDLPIEVANDGRSKKRKADESKWFKVVNRNKREKGEVYMGRNYETGSKKFKIVEKPGKELGERCYCKSVGLKCGDVLDEKRGEIFKEVWSMSWSQRETLVKSLVHRNNVGRHRVQLSESSRQNTLKYNLNVGNGLVPVCKKMFINTTGITKTFIRRHVLDEGNISQNTIQSNLPSIKREAIKEFLASLPSMPSHYCRKSSTKKYFDRSFDSKMEVYKVYLDWCKEKENAKSGSRQVFNDVLDSENYAIFRPRKDMCDTCESYEAGNIDEASYTSHRLRKEQAQNSKSEDKLLAAGSNGKIRMICVDLQAVLLAPALKASALYYRTKLCVHNYTIYDVTTRDVSCYVWHEAEGGLSANEFASCMSHYIESLTKPFDELIIYSDGCPSQNRNVIVSKALIYASQKHNIIITHKYLEKGHTQMEVDSVHHTIEQKIKNKAIYSPSDYVRLFKEARRNPFPYKVEYLQHSFFQNFSDVCGLKTIRPGKKAGDPQVVNIRGLKYSPDGLILVKLGHNEDWQELLVRGNSSQIVGEPQPLLPTQRKLTAAKYTHLQQLKMVIPKDLHTFYDSLTHD